MTVVSTVVRAEAVWTGVETEIPTGVQVQERSQLVVSLVPGNGQTQVLTLGLHYAITLSSAGVATVVPLAAFPATPGIVSMVRQTPMTQVYDPTATDTYDAAGHAAALDRSAMRVAELSQKVDDVAASAIVVIGGAASVPEGGIYVSDGKGRAVAGPSAAEIDTARAEAVSAAESSSARAQAAGASAMSAAASAAAAALFDTANYYPKAAFRTDGIASAPLMTGAIGETAVQMLRINGQAATQKRIEFWADTTLDWVLYRDADGTFSLWSNTSGTAVRVNPANNRVNFTALPTYGGSLDLLHLDTDGKLPAYDGSKLTNLPIPGAGQTLSDVTASRAIGTVYQNTTNKMIFVLASTVATGGGSGVAWNLGPTATPGSVGGTVMTNGWGLYSMLPVPPGWYYQMAASNYYIAAWREIR